MLSNLVLSPYLDGTPSGSQVSNPSRMGEAKTKTKNQVLTGRARFRAIDASSGMPRCARKIDSRRFFYFISQSVISTPQAAWQENGDLFPGARGLRLSRRKNGPLESALICGRDPLGRSARGDSRRAARAPASRR